MSKQTLIAFLCRVFLNRRGDQPVASTDPLVGTHTQHVKKIVFLRSGKLGDMIVATPLFHLIKSILPDCTVGVVCSPDNNVIIEHNPFVDTIRCVNFHSIFSVARLCIWLMSYRFDAIVDCTPGFSLTNGLILIFGCRSMVRVGRVNQNIPLLYTITADVTYPQHIVEYNVLLIEKMLGTHFASPYSVELHASEKQKADAKTFCIKTSDVSKPVIGINCSAGKPVRQWGQKNYVDLLERIHKKHGDTIQVIVFAVGPDREWANRLCATYGFCRLVPACDFMTVAQIVAVCGVLVSPDTSLVHVASAMHVPVVGLYAPATENFSRWKPYDVPHRIVFSLSTESITTIDPDAVFSAMMELLTESTNH